MDIKKENMLKIEDIIYFIENNDFKFLIDVNILNKYNFNNFELMLIDDKNFFSNSKIEKVYILYFNKDFKHKKIFEVSFLNNKDIIFYSDNLFNNEFLELFFNEFQNIKKVVELKINLEKQLLRNKQTTKKLKV